MAVNGAIAVVIALANLRYYKASILRFENSPELNSPLRFEN